MKKIFMLSTVAVLLLMSYTKIYACPKCNEDFRQQLLNERANTLGAQELLKTIENQSGSSQYVSGPAKYTFNDTLESDTKQETIESNEEDVNNFSLSTFAIIRVLSPFGFFTVSLISSII